MKHKPELLHYPCHLLNVLLNLLVYLNFFPNVSFSFIKTHLLFVVLFLPALKFFVFVAIFHFFEYIVSSPFFAKWLS